jgi:hypothetical protein
MLIENPAIGSGETTPSHQAFASIETKAWPPLIHFLYDVQRPDAVVFENVNLAIDSSDPTTCANLRSRAGLSRPA